MRVAVVARDGAQQEAEDLVTSFGFILASDQPELVMSYGGDGTLLIAEERFPGIPKVPLRNSAICKKCSILPNDELLAAISVGAYTVEELYKLEASAHDRTLKASSEISVRNLDPRRAIRFQFCTDGRSWSHELIGDGILIATPFGSTGYYRSITRSFFEAGLGIAFNNVTEPIDHLVVADTSVVHVTITRGPAFVIADTQEDVLKLESGDMVEIRRSSETPMRLVTATLDPSNSS